MKKRKSEKKQRMLVNATFQQACLSAPISPFRVPVGYDTSRVLPPFGEAVYVRE